ncbi:MAG: nucleotidyltransferase family protein [Candidatus Nezhaarchaeales archaeon]
MPAKTLKLVESIDSGSVLGSSIEELVKLARLNKVLLGFLRRIGYEGSLRVLEEDRYRCYMSEVARVSGVMSGLDYALFKFRKPVEHVSVDIDILVYSKHLREAVRRLKRAGFRVEVLEPYTVTMIRGGTIVDLYTHPSFAWIVYLDGERLLEEVETIGVKVVGSENVEVKTLSLEAEVVVAAAHAIYKEHIYLLADYYVIKQWLNKKALKLAEELNAEEALQASLELNYQIEKGLTETPIKLNPTQTAKILATKFKKDPNFRATTINTVKLLPKKRTIQQLIQRIRRKTY